MSDSGIPRREDRPTPEQLERERLRFATSDVLLAEVDRLRAELACLQSVYRIDAERCHKFPVVQLRTPPQLRP